jgi:hypothetical protein
LDGRRYPGRCHRVYKGGDPVTAKRKTVPVVTEDPAGLDKVLVAAGKGCCRFLEGLLSKQTGVPINLWDGKDGMGAILEESLKRAGVPNKRLPELVTPRAILQETGVIPKKKKRRLG